MNEATNNGNEKIYLPVSAEEFRNRVDKIVGNNFDIILSTINTKMKDVIVIYIDGMVNKDLMDRDIIFPLKSADFKGSLQNSIKTTYEEVYDITSAMEKVFDGNVVVYYDQSESVIISDLKKWEKRAVETPEAEGVTRGPKEGYTENILTNITLLRRKLKTSNLTIENIVLGRQSNTAVAIIYLKDIVNKKVLKEVRNRLNDIDVDCILESGEIEQYLDDNAFNIVSGIGMTQKPDTTAAMILEGRVAIMTDGTPHVLTIPELFSETLHTSEGYYSRTLYSNFLRMIRTFALFISIFLPGFFVAMMTFNQEMVPFIFMQTFIKATTETPLPEGVELLFLAIMFELIKEAGLRMPKAIGSAITIVGALILGDVAVSAGIVGAPSVIIIAICSVASLLIANLNEFTTIYRFLFLILGSMMGIIGIATGIIIMLAQLLSKESFGVPIFAFFSKEELKDSLIRFPLKSLNYRPQSIVKNNVKRSNMTNEDGGINA